MAVDARTKEKARRFRELALESVLVLPNAWDAASAAVIAEAGARAIATSSAAMAWSLGRGDGQKMSREEMARAAARVVAAVELPVTVDAEAGYGPTEEDAVATATAVIAAGAIGLNLEDSTVPRGPLFTVERQSARIRAARAAAVEAGLPELVINARTDVYLSQTGAAEYRLGEALDRAVAYAEAGADSFFVPALLDLDTLRELAEASPLPLNALAMPGGPSVAELAQAGVRRISLGAGVARAAYSAAREAALELLNEGTFKGLEGTLEASHLNSLFS
ncbi:isocitrate lyase/phosphoenolpyruvate mutase family protein [Streptantibioticus rubrisoli]|uniref:Isocitrate lyase/phosphoenolpyruvate mutase family protein n=1 Tax=Streptantibioticus rubrisoli TaxID=1387313 RepID=A0ABT1P522_9ACTN|nr:isocitrate lyase/phosphoenolpyruvate mutase family protein [Streptantibioticus rubrisoli]MCQ4040461.1 isocitrate lyase/phosphoenolpyruvate mutase family protein [Streptantibioticus rubrisoli]